MFLKIILNGVDVPNISHFRAPFPFIPNVQTSWKRNQHNVTVTRVQLNCINPGSKCSRIMKAIKAVLQNPYVPSPAMDDTDK